MTLKFFWGLFFLATVMEEVLAMPTSNPAQPCDTINCQLPNCRCASTDVPGGLNPQSIPQIITISFDDAFRVIDYNNYYKPVFGNRLNPNNCPIGITYFVSHSYTDYALMETAYALDRAEFADHSVTHRTPSTWWTSATEQQWTSEINDQKDIMELWGGIPQNEVKGFRAPYLATSENELKVLHDNAFSYEASMSTDENYWPFTLDYKSPICNSPSTCPVNSYPGLWLVPVKQLQQSNGFPCVMLDACTAPITKQDWLDFLWENFDSHYNTNRSPFGLYSHAAWFYISTARVEAMNEFLDEVLALGDVYVVTQSQMLHWVRNPVPSSTVANFEPWKCPPRQAPRCDYQNPTCNTIQFKSCSSCPNTYPTIGNPEGN